MHGLRGDHLHRDDAVINGSGSAPKLGEEHLPGRRVLPGLREALRAQGLPLPQAIEEVPRRVLADRIREGVLVLGSRVAQFLRFLKAPAVRADQVARDGEDIAGERVTEGAAQSPVGTRGLLCEPQKVFGEGKGGGLGHKWFLIKKYG